MERRRCNHHELDDPLSTLECLSSVIDPKKSATNRNRYVIASQEEEVRRYCRGVKGVPLIYVKRSVMILEPMAETTVGVKEGIERDKFRTGLRARLGKRKRDGDEGKEAENEDRPERENSVNDGRNGEEKAVKRKRTHGPKGPNPLSVKKSRKGDSKTETIDEENPTLAGEKHEDDTGIASSIVVPQGSDTVPVPPGRRKRKRKHKPGAIEELRRELAEGGESSP
ncbi:MAG: hypothetical protein Q9170_004685 [Blastenia crenularia]